MNKKLIEVDAQAFDDLMYWLDRCSEKGHLENCADLVDPWAIFDAKGWRVVEATQPAAVEPVAPKEVGEMTITVRDGMTWFAFEEYGEAYKLPEGLHYLYTAPHAAGEAVRKDAERYRWLRDYHIGDDPESINLDRAKRKGLNAAIDAAIHAQASEGG